MKRSVLPITGLIAALALAAGAPAAQPNKRPTDAVRGKELYERHCEACHGAYARGHGPATEALVHEVPDLLGRVKADDPTIRVVLRGKAAMPGYEQTFDKHDAKRVLQHMARLEAPGATAPANARPPQPPPPPSDEDDAGDDAQAPPGDE
jgi:mono/diheme cytochrome c family protein